MLMIWICRQLCLLGFVIQGSSVDWNDPTRDPISPVVWLIPIKDRARRAKPSAAIQRPPSATYPETHLAPPFSRSRIQLPKTSQQTFSVVVSWCWFRPRVHRLRQRVPMNGSGYLVRLLCKVGVHSFGRCRFTLSHCTPPVFLHVSARRAKGASTDASVPASSRGGA